MDEQEFEITGSVTRALSDLKRKEPILASDFVHALFRLHPEYANQKARSAKVEDTKSRRKGQEWLSQIKTLFDFERMRSHSKSNVSPEINGRKAIIGLCLLEPSLRQQLDRLNLFQDLVKELDEPLEEILSTRGRALFKAPESLADTVSSILDDPVEKVDDDLLGRAAFAQFLARRIDTISRQEPGGAYPIHVKGPWGAGKSTLLNFLRAELRKQGNWLVVDFNAWRNQHISPPWWSLMEKVFNDTKKKLSLFELISEYWWRFNTGRLHYIIGFITLIWLIALFFIPFLRGITNQTDMLGLTATAADNITKVLALVATVWGGIVALNRSLLLSSARAAQSYAELAYDSTEQIKKRFNNLIKSLSPNRVAILVDDLDRCQSDYVVELLEGIQTLFREAPVVFVIAADERWLNACYEVVYEKLKGRVKDIGKPLGSLFLEKAFRFSTPLPGIPDELKKKYWVHLLQLQASDNLGNEKVEEDQARDLVANARSEDDVRKAIKDSRNFSFTRQRAVREAAVVRLAAPEILERLEHTLTPYVELLEPNPRSMKRLINAYSANRALTILAEVEIELHQLALWTILSARWPYLADYLIKHPAIVNGIRRGKVANLPDDIDSLLSDRDVLTVIRGGAVGKPLLSNTVLNCGIMQAGAETTN